MQRLNEGLIFTNDKCVGCNKCIAVCPNKGANNTMTEGMSTRVLVVGDRCTDCGRCVKECTHHAREFRDDSKAFLDALDAGEEISLLVSPSFYDIFPNGAEHVLGYLKSRGVKFVYDVGFGAEISLWAHVKYLIEHKDEEDHAFIGHTCHAIVKNFSMYHPELLKYVIPVHSPVSCMAIYARKYLKDSSKLACMSPCISKSDEFAAASISAAVDYSITYDHLYRALKDVDMSEYSAQADVQAMGIGSLYHVAGRFKEFISLFFHKKNTLLEFSSCSESNLNIVKSFLAEGMSLPMFVEFYSCENGCFMGPGIPPERRDYKEFVNRYLEKRRELDVELEGEGSYHDNRAKMFEKIKELGLIYEDFTRGFAAHPVPSDDVPSSLIEEVFSQMRKDSPKERSINCGGCGYATCVDMAKAVALGNNKKENCIRYSQNELMYRFYTDSLTGLYSHSGFCEIVDKLFKDNPDKTYAVCIGELNQLSIVNELYGFETGDKFLCAAAEYVKEVAGPNTVVARGGAGRFYICALHDDKALKQLNNVPTFDFHFLGITFPISFSLGICLKHGDESLDEIFNKAIMTLDRIPESISNSILVYDENVKGDIGRDIMVSTSMHEALKAKEFVPFFQPQYDHRTGQIIGAEVLCRWIKSDGQMVSPGVFIPVFERNGFVHNLDHYMWERAFECIRSWLDEGIDCVPISVNVSRISLMNGDFIPTVKRLSNAYKIPTKFLHFEITESAYAKNADDVISKIEGLHELGFSVAMDDFGTGYSSLNTLKDLPFDILKLDMGFLRGGHVENGEKIIQHVVDMAEDLSLETISEGVETKEQADFLLDNGCFTIQGYYYAKPMSQADYEKILKGESN